MFGLLYSLFGIGARGVSKVGGAIVNNNERERAKQSGKITYTDINGKTRMVSDDTLVVYTWDENKNKIIEDPMTGKVYKNFGDEQKQERMMAARQRGDTVISIQHIPCQYKWGNNKLGTVYQDINNGSLYIAVSVNYIQFYMDVQSGHLIRIKDKCTDKRKKGNLSVKEIIAYFNARQDKIKGTFTRQYEEDSQFYLRDYYKHWYVDDDGEVKYTI